MSCKSSIIVAAALLSAFSAAAWAAEPKSQSLPILQGRPDRDASDADALGAAFESQSAGISIRPPAGSRTIRRAVSADEIVEFVNDDKNWMIKVSRITTREPMGLLKFTAKDGSTKPGLMEATLEQFNKSTPGAEVVRNDVVNIGANPVGMLAMRYTQNAQRRLTQQAVIQSNDQLFYVIMMNSPGAVRGADAN